MFKLNNKKEKVALLSIGSNSTLIILKIVAGLLSGSVSIISEAIHSSMDLLASLIAFFSVRMSSKPADRDHPYGHGKIENVSGVAEGILIFIAAFLIIKEAVTRIMSPSDIGETAIAVIVMFVSALINFIVSSILYKTAKEVDSIALEADALHLRTDVYTSLGVGGGLLLMKIFEFLGFEQARLLDPLAAIVVALLIIKEAWMLCKNAFSPLLDVKLSDSEEDKIREIADRYSDIVKNLHSLRTRKAGNIRYIDFHIEVEGSTSVNDAHNISDILEDEIAKEISNSNVNIHIEPLRENREDQANIN